MDKKKIIKKRNFIKCNHSDEIVYQQSWYSTLKSWFERNKKHEVAATIPDQKNSPLPLLTVRGVRRSDSISQSNPT